MKNIKYFAGLIDADGSFDLSPRKLVDGTYRVNARVSLYQKDQQELLQQLGDHFNVNVNLMCDGNLGCVRFANNKAIRLIEHLRNHLVIKRPVAEFVEKQNGKIVTKGELAALKNELRELRKQPQPEKNFPSRKWMAGYVDGDGCLGSQYNKKTGSLEFKLSVVSHETQMVGLNLIQKCFGGRIHREGNTQVMRYALTLTPNNISKLDYFGKHLIIKHEQYKFIRDVLVNRKHYLRNGGTAENNLEIHRELQSMKGTRND